MQSQAAGTVCHTPAHDAVACARRQPEATPLDKMLHAHYLAFRAAIEIGGGELPAFVRDELEAYFRRGILVHGHLRVRCKDRGHRRVGSFSRKRSGFCPSCLSRRMAAAGDFYVAHLFPRVPARQLVLTVPVRLRFRMAYSHDLTTAVLRCFIAAITSDLRHRARKRKLLGDPESGAITVFQRFGSSAG